MNYSQEERKTGAKENQGMFFKEANSTMDTQS